MILSQSFRSRMMSWIPGMAVAFGLFFTGLATTWALRSIDAEGEERFQTALRAVERRIEGRLQEYSRLLEQTKSYFDASEKVTRDEFHTYVENLRLISAYPGVQGLGYAGYISASLKLKHEDDIRRESGTNYQVWPEGERDHYFPILYLEPKDWRNERALGYDMYTETTRREAMKRSWESKQIALSGRVRLVQETGEDVQSGFLLYLPRFERTPLKVMESDVLQGFIFSPFRARDFFDAIFSESLDDEVVRFGIYDGEKIESWALLYESEPSSMAFLSQPQFNQTRQIRFAGRTWTLVFESRETFGVTSDRWAPIGLALSGLALSLMLGLWLRTLRDMQGIEKSIQEQKSREAFEVDHRVQKKTLELTKQNQYMYQLIEHVHSGVVACDAFGRITHLNKYAREIHGLPASPIPPEKWAEYYDLFEENERTPLALEKIPLFRALQGEKVRDAKFVVVPKGGVPKHLLSSGEAIYTAAGELAGAVIVLVPVDVPTRS